MVIKLFQHFSELTTEDEENRKPGRRRRQVASSVPTTNQHKYETQNYISLNRMHTIQTIGI